jgi:IclR family transcriptional regulator, KDG regulon repressor
VSGPEAWHVARTLRALEVLALGPHSAIEVADALFIHPRTARRLLDRLVAEGYLTRSPDPPRKYVSTLRLVALAGQVVQNAEVVQAAEPHLRRLNDETGAVAHLSVPSLVGVVCVLHADAGAQPPVPSLGERIPCHATAAGKALLAFRDSWRSHVLEQPLEPFTARTVTGRAALGAEVRRIRARGYAVEDGEYRLGQCGIAAPVFSHAWEAVAALGVSGPRDLLPRSRRRTLGALVAETAAAVSRDVGYGPGDGERPAVNRSAHGQGV